MCIGHKSLPVFQESTGSAVDRVSSAADHYVSFSHFESVVRGVGGNLMSIGIESGQEETKKKKKEERVLGTSPTGRKFSLWGDRGREGQNPCGGSEGSSSSSSCGWSVGRRRLQIIMEIVSLRLYYCVDPSSFAHSIFPFFFFIVFYSTGDPFSVRN